MKEYPSWMNDPLVANIDMRKLEFLGNIVSHGQGKSQKEAVTYMMSAMKQAKTENISFSSGEITAIVAAIKRHSTPEELQKINEVMQRMPPR